MKVALGAFHILLRPNPRIMHNAVKTWKCFQHYWPFVWQTNCSSVDSRYKLAAMRSLGVSFVVMKNKLLNTQSCFIQVSQFTLFHLSVRCYANNVLNSFGFSDTIWRHRSGSTLVQVMASCLMASNHYLNHCWLINNEVHWHLSEGCFTETFLDITHEEFLKISQKSLS